MALKDALREKITTEEQWEELLETYADELLRPCVGTYAIEGEGSYSPWWAQREAARIQHGVYNISSTLEEVNNLRPGMFVHASVDDPTMIAYTLDAEAGKADRQLKTTLGKFLRKHFILFQDHVIETLTTKHKADLSDEIEFVTGLDIVKVYKSRALESCMTKDFDSSAFDGHHPTEVYDAPNIRMAVLRDSSGKITARSLVYEPLGPSGSEKFYIRCYGEGTLQRRLVRQGYTPGSFLGAKLKKIPLPKLNKDYYAMPYLDSFGGASTIKAGVPVLLDDEIVIMPTDQAHAIESFLGLSIGSSTSTLGYVKLSPVKSSDLTVVDPILGESVDILELAGRRLLDYVTTSGEVVRSRATAVEYRNYRGVAAFAEVVNRCTFNSEGIECMAYCLGTDETFSHKYDRYLDTPATRKALGYARLSQMLYPELWEDGKTPEYLAKGDYVFVDVSGEQHAVLKSDCVKVLRKGDQDTVVSTYQHRTTFVKTSYVKVHRSSAKDPDTWAPHELIVQTSSGRKVVPNYHDVRQEFFTGMWEFERNLTSLWLDGTTYYVRRETPNAERRVADEIAQRRFDEFTARGATVEALQIMQLDLSYSVPCGRYNSLNIALERLERQYQLPYALIVEAAGAYLKTLHERLSRRLGTLLLYYAAEISAVDYNLSQPEELETLLADSVVEVAPSVSSCVLPTGMLATTPTVLVSVSSGTAASTGFIINSYQV